MSSSMRLFCSVSVFAVGFAVDLAGEESCTNKDHVLLQLGKSSTLEKHSANASSTEAGYACSGFLDVERKCSTDGCKVLATNMRGRSCNSYCESQGSSCVGAWEEVKEDCNVKDILTCEDASVPTSDLICECTPPTSPPAYVPVSTFFWNVHWECSLAARGASHSCKSRIGRQFVKLARQANAEVVASVELSEGMSRPASLINFGLTGWTQVDGPCSKGSGGDSAALAFAPGWQVLKSSGGCLRSDYDTRAFAVARVAPPAPVKGCPNLCFVAIHAPHTSINAGMDRVRSVCGEAAKHCSVAMGDWNTPASGVGRLWSELIGGTQPSSAQPDERTCCWPESHHYGVFDHLATNVQGASHGGQTVHPYQLLEENPIKQHRAVAARLMLPRA